MGVHLSISMFVCMFEEGALESDVRSHYYTAGYWQGIRLCRGRACKIGLIICRVQIQALICSPLHGSWLSSSAADEEPAEQISLERRQTYNRRWHQTISSKYWFCVCFLAFKSGVLLWCWTLHCGDILLCKIWFQIVASAFKSKKKNKKSIKNKEKLFTWNVVETSQVFVVQLCVYFLLFFFIIYCWG